nr:unnamed protein product [Digitaria exilis]
MSKTLNPSLPNPKFRGSAPHLFLLPQDLPSLLCSAPPPPCAPAAAADPSPAKEAAAPRPYPPPPHVMPPRPSLHSLLLMAASSSAAAAGGDSGLLLAARRRLPVAAVAAVSAGGHRIRLLHSFSGPRFPIRHEVACCVRSAPGAARPPGPVTVRSRNVHSANKDRTASEARLGQLVQRLKNEGINPKQWRIGSFQRMMCPKCNGGSNEELSLSVYIRHDGMNASWNCFRSTCGWRGFVQPDEVPKVSQAKSGIESETDQEVEASKAAKKVYRKIREEDLNLEPLCDEISIAFTYRRDGVVVGCKYREVDKKFSQEANTEKIFYGLDDIKRAQDIIIVEGEIDKLSMDEAGFRNCVSVPDGAPPKVSSKIPEKEQASRIILATDDDVPGQALAEELARRLGKERCWRVKWPKKNETDTCKDANEVLMYLGPQALRKVIEDAELYPIRGLFAFRDFFPEIDNYYLGIHGDELGIRTGWESMDDLYKVREHARKLLEKRIEKPFFDARYGGSAERMTPDEFEAGKQWLNETFHLIRCEDDSLPSINWVLDLAKAAVLRHGIRGLVIDPYNELDHQRPSNQNRDQNAGPLDVVQVCVRKVRNKVIGQIGDAFLTYNRVTGKFKDADKPTIAAATAASAQKRTNSYGTNSYVKSTKDNVAYEMPFPIVPEDDLDSSQDGRPSAEKTNCLARWHHNPSS